MNGFSSPVIVRWAGEFLQWYVTFWWADFCPIKRLRHWLGVGSYAILCLSASTCLAIHSCWLLLVGFRSFIFWMSKVVVGCTQVSTNPWTRSKLQWTETASSVEPPLGSNQ